MPKTGNNKIIYPLAIASVLAIIGIFIFVKKKYFKKEM
jgi:LPXTG-motif cell wall-anchored protein